MTQNGYGNNPFVEIVTKRYTISVHNKVTWFDLHFIPISVQTVNMEGEMDFVRNNR